MCLPIPTGLQTQYTQSWSAATVEGRNSILSDKGGNVIRSMATALNASGGPNAAEAGGQTLTKILSDLGEGLNLGGESRRLLNDMKGSAFWNEAAGGVASEMAAMVAAGPAEGLATAAQYTTGMRAVKQTMMSYGGPGFRSFSYTSLLNLCDKWKVKSSMV